MREKNKITQKVRPLYEIAKDISEHWKPIHEYAQQHVAAFAELDSINDIFITESGKDIILGFLCNAGTWRGEHARRIKTELKEMIK